MVNPGDIEDLFKTPLKPGHAAAFSTDCDLPATHEMVRSIGMQVHFEIFKVNIFWPSSLFRISMSIKRQIGRQQWSF